MAHVYAHLFGVRCTGLRFFSVYGPWGRPDMAPFKFVHSIVSGKPITVYGDGKQTRDWTFIDDVVEGVVRALDQPATAGMQFKYSSKLVCAIRDTLIENPSHNDTLVTTCDNSHV